MNDAIGAKAFPADVVGKRRAGICPQGFRRQFSVISQVLKAIAARVARKKGSDACRG